MKIATPRIYLINKPSFNEEALKEYLYNEELPDITQSSTANNEDEAIVETAARLCYNSFGRGRKNIKDFIDNLLKSKDGSVFEHVNYGFLMVGISRSLSHELVRHRAGFAYSQQSQRYVDESEAGYVLPPLYSELEPEDAYMMINLFDEFMEENMSMYNSLVSMGEEMVENKVNVKRSDQRKVVRSAARAVLPNMTETRMMVTANVRAWRHFIEMRASYFADAEIRRLALMVLDVLKKEAPLFFDDFEVKEQNGVTIAVPEYSKV